MVWPRRKIQLVASSAAPGMGGVRAILNGTEIDFIEVEPNAEEFSVEFKDRWMEEPFEDASKSEAKKLGPVTELVYWQEGQENDLWREKTVSKGIKQQSVQSLIHNLLEEELILWVSEPTVLLKERPLLGHILDEAGFEPTLLWPNSEGKWQCQRKLGIHWIMPDSWLEGLMEKSSLGRDPKGIEEKASWVIRDNRIDFYRLEDGQKFAGCLPRWPEPLEEQTAAQIIAICIDLGVAWRDIERALSSVWKDSKRVDNLRWNFDDFRGNIGACGEKLSPSSAEYVEDWWAR